MEFCDNCQNLLKSQIVNDQKGKTKIEYHCRNCTNVKERKDKSAVYNNIYDRDIYTGLYINNHIRHDNTLPRDQSIICPNTECPSHKTDKNKISYIRYNPDALKYIYFCHFCDEEWKTS
jgi:hypothetical protein